MYCEISGNLPAKRQLATTAGEYDCDEKKKKKSIHHFQHLFLKLKYLHYEDMVFSIPVENRHAHAYTGISTFTQIVSYSHCPLTILIEQVQGASNRCVQLGLTWGPSAVAAAPPKAGSLPQALKNHSAVARHPYAQFLKSPVQGARDGIYCSRCLCGSSAEY